MNQPCTERRRLVEGIWNCISLLHKSGRLPEPSVQLLVRFGAEDRVTEEEAMDVATEDALEGQA